MAYGAIAQTPRCACLGSNGKLRYQVKKAESLTYYRVASILWQMVWAYGTGKEAGRCEDSTAALL